ncbi:DUF1648 domain-containing protein [Glycomyces buryatensis]|uniref:DUF5808 domain-containing protein n=1 Tax=Glycomyces buryatensis TaxID=2570927 RepID=A0A4S8QLQ2_9ACTN|nr:hypothetical protein [Glycomyces buryatensis]THV41664.1 hypothetical protein FAB82_09720 [Glycomyces buryatensis]
MNLTSLTLLPAMFGMVTAIWWSLPYLSRPTFPFGVQVPADRIGEAPIGRTRKTFARNVIVFGLVAAAASIPLSLRTDPRTVISLGVTGLVLADFAAYSFAGRQIRVAKQAGDWYGGARQGVTADLSFRTDPLRVNWRGLIPAAAILTATIIVGVVRSDTLPATLPGLEGLDLDGGPRVPTGFWFAANPVIAQAAVTLGTALVLAAILRARPEIDAAKPAATARRYRTYLRGLANLGFLTAACANLTLAGIALRLWEILPASPLGTIAIATPILAAAAAVVRFELRIGAGGHRLPDEPSEAEERTGLVQRDDDRHWHLGGFVYINRDDPAFFVHQRAGGSQWTLNLGHPAGWISVAALILVALAAVAAALADTLGILDLPNTHGF